MVRMKTFQWISISWKLKKFSWNRFLKFGILVNICTQSIARAAAPQSPKHWQGFMQVILLQIPRKHLFLTELFWSYINFFLSSDKRCGNWGENGGVLPHSSCLVPGECTQKILATLLIRPWHFQNFERILAFLILAWNSLNFIAWKISTTNPRVSFKSGSISEFHNFPSSSLLRELMSSPR